MTDETTSARRRTTWAWLAAAVLVATAACGGEAADEPADAGSPTAEAPSEPTTTELSMPSSETGRCMPPNVANLQAQEVAFEGTVIALEGEQATLEVAEWFKGDETDQVAVTSPGGGLADLELGVDFELGATYLVSASGGQVTVCGLSAEKDDRLEELYEQAYGH
ncbi:hypothetical protein DDE18_03140 [Nocardioides gansuensis]|uniref:Lipoprotein n=1 Tax=Nocardioides gansuensis TaxID=2138300 RepID=A0A2T8FFY9_9ACTN|nr:hypothetical protein [Nocardioides gansuensis]PVG84610.1 hypothetical protein DDE18_03140 [Nocardioides gansuensis]